MFISFRGIELDLVIVICGVNIGWDIIFDSDLILFILSVCSLFNDGEELVLVMSLEELVGQVVNGIWIFCIGYNGSLNEDLIMFIGW